MKRVIAISITAFPSVNFFIVLTVYRIYNLLIINGLFLFFDYLKRSFALNYWNDFQTFSITLTQRSAKMIETTNAKQLEIYEIVNEVIEFVKNQAELAKLSLSDCFHGDADTTERCVFEHCLKIGAKLMAYYFEQLGSMDLGKEIEVEGKRFTREVCAPATHLTVFGEINFKRFCYYSADGESIKPLDATANLPDRQASYFVQDLLSRLGIKNGTYEETRLFFKDLFSHSFSKRTLEEIVWESASAYENYKETKPLAVEESEGELCVLQGDGKGVPVLPGENPNSTGKMKEALVGVVYTVNSHVRSAEEVAYSLTNPKLLTEDQQARLRDRDGARNINYQASVEQEKEEVFESLRAEVDQRSKEKKKLVEKAITYYENHREYLNYDDCLAKGYPIGTGVVESACGHLVKDRMQKSGARWKIIGAEPVLKLRSVSEHMTPWI